MKKSSVISYKLQYSANELFKKNKWKLIITSIVILVGIAFGIIFGFNHLTENYVKGEFISKFLTGNMSNFSSLFYRLLSVVLIMALLYLLSLTIWTLPLGLILLFYRAYLLGINLAILLRFYGISGIVLAILIFPFQLLILIYLVFFYLSLLFDKNGCIIQNKLAFVLISLGIILLVNILLSLVLLIFSPNIIFIL